MEWISVKDRLPTINDGSGRYAISVLTFDMDEHKECGEVALYGHFYFEGNKFIELDGYGEWCDCHVTHWMPLPEPPK